MATIEIASLSEDVSFGARITGVTLTGLDNEATRARVRQVFEERGLIVFEGVERTSEMHLALSRVFGPLQEHSYKGIPLADGKLLPGVVDIASDPADADVFEVEGKQVASWIPWHFDACYTARLNRGGILRALEIPASGGMTGFADGVQIYQAVSPELRERFENLEILYHPSLMFWRQRFARPNFRPVTVHQAKHDLIDSMKDAPRSVHPAVWTRASGEKVMHVSPWQADGIAGMETSEGDALLEALCQEIVAKVQPYFHDWALDDMVVWDNWRFLHTAAGHDPAQRRHMHRTTIEGDYGLGRFEDGAIDREPVRMMD